MNAKGKVERISAVTAKTREQITVLSNHRRKMLDQDLESARESLPAKLPGPDTEDVAATMRDELRMQEIRRHLSEMKPARPAAPPLAPPRLGGAALHFNELLIDSPHHAHGYNLAYGGEWNAWR